MTFEEELPKTGEKAKLQVTKNKLHSKGTINVKILKLECFRNYKEATVTAVM